MLNNRFKQLLKLFLWLWTFIWKAPQKSHQDLVQVSTFFVITQNVLSDLSYEENIYGMLKMWDCDSIDEVLAFHEAITDLSTGSSAALVIQACTIYCNVLNLLHQHFLEPVWSDGKVSLPAESAKNSKSKLVNFSQNTRLLELASRNGTFLINCGTLWNSAKYTISSYRTLWAFLWTL